MSAMNATRPSVVSASTDAVIVDVFELVWVEFMKVLPL